jgi:hypothetical protein
MIAPPEALIGRSSASDWRADGWLAFVQMQNPLLQFCTDDARNEAELLLPRCNQLFNSSFILLLNLKHSCTMLQNGERIEISELGIGAKSSTSLLGAASDIHHDSNRLRIFGSLPSERWKLGVMSGGIIATIVCLTNISVLTWAVATHGVSKDGTGVLYQGSCSTMQNINVIVHLFINASSALLLSASNYTM